MTKADITGDGRTISVRVPISIRKVGSRKLVLAPDGTDVMSIVSARGAGAAATGAGSAVAPTAADETTTGSSTEEEDDDEPR